MADIRYVQEGYVTDSYVQITFDVSATADLFLAPDRSWDEMGTWQTPTQEYWTGFSADALVFQPVQSDISVAVTTSQSATLTKQATASIQGDTGFSVTATAQREGETLTVATITTTADAILTAQGETTINIGTVTVQDGIVGQLAQAQIDCSISTTADTQLTTLGTADISTNLQLTSAPGRVQLSTAELQQVFGFSGAALSGTFGDITIPVTISTSVEEPLDIFRSTANISLNADITPPNTSVFIGAGPVVINIGTITTSFAREFVLDPFRIHSIKTETRINILEQETRSYMIPSETRQLEVQTLNLVDVAGSAIDRREG